MSQKTVVSLIDDLDGESEAAETVQYSLDGVTYEIDLTEEHAAELRDTFAPYVAAARRTGGRRATRRSTSGSTSASTASTSSGSGSGIVSRSRETLKQIREWAKGEGWPVSERGRLPNKIVEAYDAAHK
jgi:Lsr2